MNNCYCSIGCYKSPEDIDNLERILTHNYSVISKFNYIVAQHNSNQPYSAYSDQYNNVWKKVFGKDVMVLPTMVNKGHTFGALELDNSVISHAKTLPIEFIYKSTNDILLMDNLLKYDVNHDFSFYYLQGIGYTGFAPFDYNIHEYLKNYTKPEFLYPQTNFYIITKNVDCLIDNDELLKTYEFCRSIPNFNGRPWEYIRNYSCEDILKECVIRNNLKTKHLISDESFLSLLNFVKEYKICDCSHKNIILKDIGVCHYHDISAGCVEI